MTRWAFRLRALALAVCLFAAPPCWAQSAAGRISGRVLDPASRAAAEAHVGALNVETGRSYRTAAGREGEYVFAVLPAGEYELRASAPDLEGTPRRVRLEVGRNLGVDLELTVAPIAAVVDVEDSTPLIDAAAASIGYAINRERLADLPLNRREFLQLALLAGGANPAAPDSELSRQNDSGLHLHGARESSNNFLLDGVDNNDVYINRLVVSPPLDAVREFRLHSANYHAEYGRSGGAQVNVVTRGGTNDFHGSLYDYFRNEALDARNFFDPAGQRIPKYRRNQFGVAAGGPLRRERAFFFGGYEGTRIRNSVTNTARVPNPAELAGDFSGSGQALIDPFTQAPFPGNRIPAQRIDPIGAALGSFWPAPNRADPAQNLVSTPDGDGLINQLYGRADWYATECDTLYARYNFSHNRALDPFRTGGTNTPGFGAFVIDRGRNLAVSETHLFSPSAISESRFGFNRLERRMMHQNAGVDFAAHLGIPGLTADPRFTGFPALNTPGYDNLGDATALPIIREDDTFHAVQSVTLLRGPHTLKLGGEFRHVRIDGIQGLFGRGQFNFLGAFTQNPVGDLLLGFPTFTIQTAIDNPFRQRASFWNAYLQDDWRVSPSLTVSAGLRYEWNQPAYDADDRFNYFDVARRELVPAGTGDLGRAGYRGDANNFAPRLGLSWQPGGGWVARAAYGVFYDVTVLQANSGLYFNPPYFDLRLFFPSGQRLLTLSDPFPAGAGITPLPSVNAIQPDLRTGYAQHWNVGLERALPGRTVLRISYVGSKGTKLLRRRDLNQPAPGPGDVNARRPIAGFANLVQFESAASSSYHSGLVTLERRLGNGVNFSASYTLSKSIDGMSAFLDSAGDQGFPQNSHDFRAERGLSSFDQRQRLVFTASLDSPFRSAAGRGWQLLTIGSFGTGRPLTPALSVDRSNSGNAGSIFGQDRPDAIGDPFVGASAPERFFNTDAFAPAAPFTFGNAGRNVLRGPGFASLDAALVRHFALSEGARLSFRAEAFNLANRANFELPQRFADQPTFGRINSAQPARQLQLGLRVTF